MKFIINRIVAVFLLIVAFSIISCTKNEKTLPVTEKNEKALVLFSKAMQDLPDGFLIFSNAMREIETDNEKQAIKKISTGLNSGVFLLSKGMAEIKFKDGLYVLSNAMNKLPNGVMIMTRAMTVVAFDQSILAEAPQGLYLISKESGDSSEGIWQFKNAMNELPFASAKEIMTKAVQDLDFKQGFLLMSNAMQPLSE